MNDSERCEHGRSDRSAQAEAQTRQAEARCARARASAGSAAFSGRATSTARPASASRPRRSRSRTRTAGGKCREYGFASEEIARDDARTATEGLTALVVRRLRAVRAALAEARERGYRALASPLRRRQVSGRRPERQPDRRVQKRPARIDEPLRTRGRWARRSIRELAILKRAFNLAAQAGPPLVQKVPYIRMFGESAARDRVFRGQQSFRPSSANFPTYLRAPLEVARQTGWRIASEVLTRRAKHLDLASGWLRLDSGETKNGEGKGIPADPGVARGAGRPARSGPRALEKARGDHRAAPLSRRRRPGHRKLSRALAERLQARGHKEAAARPAAHCGAQPRTRGRAALAAAMAMAGHKTESVYRRYSIVDAKVLEEAAVKLALLQANEVASTAESDEMPIQKVGTDDEC